MTEDEARRFVQDLHETGALSVPPEALEVAIQEHSSKGSTMDLSHGQLAHRFQFHPADAQNRKDAHQTVRNTLLEAAGKIVEVTGPPTREQSLAITKLEEAMFWANAAIARGDGPAA